KIKPHDVVRTPFRELLPLIGRDHVVRRRDQPREIARLGGIAKRAERADQGHGSLDWVADPERLARRGLGQLTWASYDRVVSHAAASGGCSCTTWRAAARAIETFRAAFASILRPRHVDEVLECGCRE